VSTSDKGQDVRVQLDELRQIAGQRGWNVVGEYVDDGVSGTAPLRPALDRLVADAASGKLDVVAVWRLDRLGRNLAHLLSLLDGLSAQGVGFASAKDAGIDTTTPTGRLLLQLLGAFAEFERSLIRERVIAGVRRAQAEGKHCGRPRKDIPLEAAQVLLEAGRSLREVSAMLRVDRNVLRDRLRETGAWPPNGRVETLAAGSAERVG
jgi:DNA invertase Pin-like site-specific DNA recombinase